MAVFFEPKSERVITGPFTDECEAIGGYLVDPSSLPAYTRLPSGCGFSTVLPDIDFETYSEAGYYFDPDAKNGLGQWRSITKSPPHGIGAVGAAVYSEHKSTEVLSLAYNLKDGLGARLWLPCMPPPTDLFDHIAAGGLIEAWHSSFEWHIWANVCAPRLGWPKLPYWQLRDAMAKARALSLPGALGNCAKVLQVSDQKIDDGKRLLNKFSKPRNPTKKDARCRIRPEEDHKDAGKLYNYNLGDIKSGSAVSAEIPDLSDDELELWLLDQCINLRGVAIDREALAGCLEVVNQASEKYTAELAALTNGSVQGPCEIANLRRWLVASGVHMESLDSDHVSQALKRNDLPGNVRRVLEIRASLGAASVKKLFSIDRRTSRDGRLRDLFAFCGADRTGRFAGRGPQPQNLPSGGPEVKRCDRVNGCGKHYGKHLNGCPHCGAPGAFSDTVEWCVEAVEDALAIIASQSLEVVEYYYGDAMAVVSGCVRGLFIAGDNCDLICSDYSSIEAVVLAALAGEEWRLEVFRTHGRIYEMSAAKITGIPFEEFVRHKQQTGDYHIMRKKVGKVSELASGYQGGLVAWKQFGADEHLENDQAIMDAIKKWRRDSPMIVKFWSGVEDAAVAAVQNLGQCYQFRGLNFGVKDDVLYVQLLSGRKLCYHQPRLLPGVTPWGKPVLKLSYMGRESYAVPWCRQNTYGGKLTENIVQATARDILTFAMKGLERAGYAVVLHVHDEVVSEVMKGTGSVEEFESIMGTLPQWCADWPIRASGGWRGNRYRKD